MTPHRFRPVALVSVVALAVALSGCAGSESGGSGTSGSADNTASGGSSDTPPDGGDRRIQLVDTGVDVDQPIGLVAVPGAESVLIAQRDGLVREATVTDSGLELTDQVVLDLREQVGSTDGERGLLGIAVAPDGTWLYTSSTRSSDGASQLDGYELNGAPGELTADPLTRRDLLSVDQPFANHNGGHVVFGPDEMLYLGLGDGGSGGDPNGNAQDPDSLLGKILRLDVDPAAAELAAADNPFVGTDGARPEIWLTGVRNPWRFSFDAATGDLWIGDVGQNRFEEIDVLRAGAGGGRGANLGWDLFEGDQPFDDADPADPPWSDGPFVEPSFTYGRDDGCSVTGGVVYRGTQIPSLAGRYVYTDLCAEGLRSLDAADPAAGADELGGSVSGIVSIAAAGNGELYTVSLDQGIHAVVAA